MLGEGNAIIFRNAKYFSVEERETGTQSKIWNARTWERESWYVKKSFEKARGNAECEAEMKERGHASRKGPAGTRAQLCGLLLASAVCRLLHRAPPQASRLLSEVL